MKTPKYFFELILLLAWSVIVVHEYGLVRNCVCQPIPVGVWREAFPLPAFVIYAVFALSMLSFLVRILQKKWKKLFLTLVIVLIGILLKVLLADAVYLCTSLCSK